MSLMVTRTQGSCFGSSQALFCWCYASPMRSFVPQRESVSWQDRAQLHNHSNSCSPPYYLYFSFLTFNLVMHTFLRSFLWGVIGKQFFCLFQLRLFPFQSSETFIPKLQILDQNPLCFEVLKTSVTLKAATPQSQETRWSTTNHTPSAGNKRNR